MGTIKEKKNDLETMENIRVGYQVAVNLWTYQGNLNWARFNVMLTANSIIVAAISILLTQSILSLSFFLVLLPSIGLFLCVIWIFITSGGFDYHQYWISRARELEAYFNSSVNTVTEARSLKENGKIEFSWLSKLGSWLKLGKQKGVAYSVIFVFVLVYIVTLIII